jgi:hypothetical protein
MKRLYMAYVLKVNCYPAATKEVVKEYCDFTIITLQCLIGLVVGGIVITDNFVSATQRFVLSIENRFAAKGELEQERLLAELHGAAKQAGEACSGITWNNCVKKVFTLIDAITFAFTALKSDIPKFYVKLFLLRFGSSFPKGLYGVIALLLFEGMLVSQAIKSLYEYAEACP